MRAVGDHVEPVAAAAQVQAGHLARAVGARDHHGALGALGDGKHPQSDAAHPGGDRALAVGRAGRRSRGVPVPRQGEEAEPLLVQDGRELPFAMHADQHGTTGEDAGEDAGGDA